MTWNCTLRQHHPRLQFYADCTPALCFSQIPLCKSTVLGKGCVVSWGAPGRKRRRGIRIRRSRCRSRSRSSAQNPRIQWPWRQTPQTPQIPWPRRKATAQIKGYIAGETVRTNPKMPSGNFTNPAQLTLAFECSKKKSIALKSQSRDYLRRRLNTIRAKQLSGE